MQHCLLFAENARLAESLMWRVGCDDWKWLPEKHAGGWRLDIPCSCSAKHNCVFLLTVSFWLSVIDPELKSGGKTVEQLEVNDQTLVFLSLLL